MSMENLENEKLKRAYRRFLADSEGFSDSTIRSIEKAIWKYEDFSKHAPFGKFNEKTAKGFKDWLAARSGGKDGGGLSLASQYHHLRHLRDFFTWLSGQPGYKSRINPFNVRYLKLDKSKTRIATTPARQEYPSLDYVKTLCESIAIKTEVDQRDRALIAFALLSGMRDAAIVSLPMECFDPERLLIFQDPKRGVKTKFSKAITTTLVPFDNGLLGYVLEWQKFLKAEKLFSNVNPLFPRTKVEQRSETDLCFEGTEIEPVFWQSAQGMRHIFCQRAQEAGLRYYSPHKFRHATVAEAGRRCRTPEEFRAISQNLGHENVGTTLSSYGKLDDTRVSELIKKMNFANTPAHVAEMKLIECSQEELVAELHRRLQRN